MLTLQRGFGAQTERFASPLNVHPATKVYFSPYPEDETFGAQHDAYLCQWQGSSQANPEWSANDMQKAVRWALASATSTEVPTLTAFVLPFYELSNTSYQQFLGHPQVHHVARKSRQAIKLRTPIAGKETSKHPKTDILCFVVANDQGLNQFCDEEQLR